MATFTPRQKNWRWVANDSATAPTALANENTRPTLVTNDNIIHLRFTFAEIGAKADNTVAVALQYSLNSDMSSPTPLGAAPAHWNYADGVGVEGDAVSGTSQLSDDSSFGEYCESGSNSLSVGASALMEVDFAIQATASVSGSTVYYFQCVQQGSALALDTSETYPELQTAILNTPRTPIMGSVVSSHGVLGVMLATAILGITPVSANITGYQPTVQEAAPPVNTDRTINTGEVRYGATAGPQNTDRTPTRATVNLSGYTPGQAVTLTTTADGLAITGYAPTATVKSSVTPNDVGLATEGYSPDLFVEKFITPIVGSLVVTGNYPTVGSDITVTPTPVNIDVLGYEPTVSEGEVAANTDITPNVNNADITENSSTVFLQKFITPITASVGIDGYSPSIFLELKRTPAVNDIDVTGYSPTLVSPTEITPPVSVLNITGYDPIVSEVGAVDNTNITPYIGELRFGQTSWTIFGRRSNLGIAGYSPTVVVPLETKITPLTSVIRYGFDIPNSSITPKSGGMRYGWSDNKIAYPLTSSLNITAIRPDTNNSGVITRTPDATSIATNGYAPTLTVYQWDDWSETGQFTTAANLQIVPSPGSIEVTSTTTLINTVRRVGLAIGVINVTGYVPTVNVPVRITPARYNASITGYTPLFNRIARITPSTGLLSLPPRYTWNDLNIPWSDILEAWGRYQPIVSRLLDNRPYPVRRSLAITGNKPTLRTAPSPYLYPKVRSLAITGSTVTVRESTRVTVNSGELSITGYTLNANNPFKITIKAGSISVTVYGVEYNAPRTIVPVKGNVVVTNLPVAFGGPVRSTPVKEQLAITGYTPGVVSSHARSTTGVQLSITGGAPTVRVDSPRDVISTDIAITCYAPTITHTYYWGRIHAESNGWSKKSKSSDGWTRISKVTDPWTKGEPA